VLHGQIGISPICWCSQRLCTDHVHIVQRQGMLLPGVLCCSLFISQTHVAFTNKDVAKARRQTLPTGKQLLLINFLPEHFQTLVWSETQLHWPTKMWIGWSMRLVISREYSYSLHCIIRLPLSILMEYICPFEFFCIHFVCECLYELFECVNCLQQYFVFWDEQNLATSLSFTVKDASGS